MHVKPAPLIFKEGPTSERKTCLLTKRSYTLVRYLYTGIKLRGSPIAFITMDSKRVVNLSHHVLTKDEYSILSKGLKFCPTPNNPDPGELKEDLDRLHKRLRQIAHYDNPENLNLTNTQIDQGSQNFNSDNFHSLAPFFHRKFKNPAKGKGPPGPLNLEAMILSNERDLLQRKEGKPPVRRNITKGESQALTNLMNNDQIVIKMADKGSATVVLNRIDYLKEGHRQLSDTKAYRVLESDPTEQFRREINNVIEEMYQSGEIDERVRQYLIEPTSKAARLYFLPKIHKGITPPPGRPVVSGNGCPTEKISSFVDYFLNPTAKMIKSYVKDTTHFLQLMKKLGKIPDGALLVTLDVVGLYPNIPLAQGITAAKQALVNFRPGHNVKPSNNTLTKLLDLVLKRNNFTFNGRHYLQLRGTAIGTKLAVGFANNYVGFFERMFVYFYHKQPHTWLRFIDDVFMIWTHGEDRLADFVQYLNSCVETIEFTAEYSKFAVNYLDMKVKLTNNMIQTDLYSKPTDSHSYLLYDSAHPQRCKDSIPYSQFLRVRRICSLDSDFKTHILELTCHFMVRGYPIKLLQEAADKVKSLDRNDLLKEAEIEGDIADKSKVFLITTYNPNYHHLNKLVFGNWDMLGRSPATDFIYQRKLMCGYRRSRNLSEYLIKANIPFKEGDQYARPDYVEPEQPEAAHRAQASAEAPKGKQQNGEEVSLTKARRQTSIKDFMTKMSDTTVNTQPGPSNIITRAQTQTAEVRLKANANLTPASGRGFNFCNRRICRYCPKLDKSGKIKSTVTGLEYSTMTNISCRSSNLIYCITCKKCQQQYVGQTSLQLKKRFVHHFYSVDISDQLRPVGKHFSGKEHKGIHDMNIHVLEFIKMPPKSMAASQVRNRVEKRWIHLLRTPAPMGLNIDDL
jgi:hypothetical protein